MSEHVRSISSALRAARPTAFWVSLAATMLLASCADEGGGPGVTSSVERVAGTLPLPATACFTQPLLDVLPNTAGLQVECTATLSGDVLPMCGASEPCWEIVPASAPCTAAPAVRGGAADQTFVIDCVVEE